MIGVPDVEAELIMTILDAMEFSMRVFQTRFLVVCC